MLSIRDMLPRNTCRIEWKTDDGRIGSGTSFFMQLPIGDGRACDLLITNRHVLENRRQLSLFFSQHDTNRLPLLGKFLRIEIDAVKSLTVFHPDKNVDLAALAVGPILHDLIANDQAPFYASLSPEQIASPEFLSDCHAIEDVLMIGYPSGLWDSVNNLPLVRRGVTASSLSIDFNGLPKFIVDIASFPGSSGSPVFIVNEGVHYSKNGDVSLGGPPRFALVGVMHATFLHQADGSVLERTIPTALSATTTNIPNNLAICIKADQINGILDQVRKIVSAFELPQISEQSGTSNQAA